MGRPPLKKSGPMTNAELLRRRGDAKSRGKRSSPIRSSQPSRHAAQNVSLPWPARFWRCLTKSTASFTLIRNGVLKFGHARQAKIEPLTIIILHSPRLQSSRRAMLLR